MPRRYCISICLRVSLMPCLVSHLVSHSFYRGSPRTFSRVHEKLFCAQQVSKQNSELINDIANSFGLDLH